MNWRNNSNTYISECDTCVAIYIGPIPNMINDLFHFSFSLTFEKDSAIGSKRQAGNYFVHDERVFTPFPSQRPGDHVIQEASLFVSTCRFIIIIFFEDASLHFCKMGSCSSCLAYSYELRLTRILEISRCRACKYSALLNTKWVSRRDLKTNKTGSIHCACPCIIKQQWAWALVTLDAILDNLSRV